MSAIVQTVVRNYQQIVRETKVDPMVDSWFLMGSPLPILSILAVYLWFVLKAGPAFMASRKPYNLQPILVLYNGYQVLFSLWLCTMPLRVNAIPYLLKHGCHPLENQHNPFTIAVSNGAWWYFFSKVIELLDTVFFVLRKKQNQVSFLNVYHHSITCFFSWCYLKYLPGEQGVVIGFLNSVVHVVLYTYYLIAALGPKYQKYLWWKKYVTKIQLAQFCIMLAYLGTLLVFDCKLPKALTFFFVGNVVIFLFLFADFYRKAYSRRSPKGSAAKSESGAAGEAVPAPSGSKHVEFCDAPSATDSGVARRKVQAAH
ncbi:hypothetical protein ONE63_008520 [Megalurothrips usitatus]|uniref:Elongation of very long chain fatty acids protein n=1 Tax=Megalurothrips usitatus TaxID=439358 RepID=A0AAV7XLF1_9NEOP|nr:hypothetical protein ONE63_008520 [Megalurothrips usitatus]